MHRVSLLAFWLCAASLIAGAFLLYPRWKKEREEATIGWDVSGYYLYLPASIIYRDLKTVTFLPGIIEKYQPTPGPMQGFQHRSGAFVLKYTCGQALQFLPWFLAAHALAGPLGYPADGFSAPYQAAISWGSLLIAFLGLWVARRNLLNFFSDKATALTLLVLTLGTNYLNYTAIEGAMTHNWLFTAYSLLIFSTIRFYRRPAWAWAAAMGGLVGWMTLTRPTELVAVLIPLFWGLASLRDVRERLSFFKDHFSKILLAAGAGAAFLLLQIAYWKYTTGEWLVYSYENQGFSWRHPHLTDVLFSYRAGWLVYSPVMAFAVVGLFHLRRLQPALFPGILLFLLVNLYLVSAWDIWWYGGSLGMRALVQGYAVWIFPLAAMVQWVLERGWRRIAFATVALVAVYLNLWWTFQAHRDGGYFATEQMTGAYFRKVLGRLHVEPDALKLLDTDEEFKGMERSNTRLVLTKDFESDTLGVTTEAPIAGTKSLILNKAQQFSPEYPISLDRKAGWLRAEVSFRCDTKEWDWWRMTQFMLRFYKGEKIIKDRMIRLQRHVGNTEVKTVWFDTRLPKQDFDRAVVLFWNAEGDKTIRLDDLRIESFE